MSIRRSCASLVLLLCVSRCGGGTIPIDSGAPDAAVADIVSVDSGMVDAAVAPDAPLDTGNAVSDAGNRITGMVTDAGFNTVATALWIGMPDSPTTTVVYLFDHPVACAELSSPGWDRRVTDMTQALEIKMIGTSTRAYTVVTGPMPGDGEASVNHTITSRAATPVETQSTTGTVTLTAINAGRDAIGLFDLTFPGGPLRGSFDATWCPGGNEP